MGGRGKEGRETICFSAQAIAVLGGSTFTSGTGPHSPPSARLANALRVSLFNSTTSFTPSVITFADGNSARTQPHGSSMDIPVEQVAKRLSSMRSCKGTTKTRFVKYATRSMADGFDTRRRRGPLVTRVAQTQIKQRKVNSKEQCGRAVSTM